MRKVLITGIGGQDGSLLAERLVLDGCQVFGIIKREAFENPGQKLKNIQSIISQIELVPVSVTDPMAIYKAIRKIQPDEIYHLAAHSFVSYEFEDEITIMDSNFNSTYYLLSSIYEVNSKCKFFFAGSSEMFGEPLDSPQAETSKFNPKSIYGISKISSFYLLKNFRDRRGMFTCTGIMYNHESSRKKSEFVTKKIIEAAVKIRYGGKRELVLGNTSALRDWGYAPDFIDAIRLIMAQEKSDDYIIATGQLHSVREFADVAFSKLGLNAADYLRVDNKFYRASENMPLCGNTAKLRALGWAPTRTFDEMIQEMIDDEIVIQGYNRH